MMIHLEDVKSAVAAWDPETPEETPVILWTYVIDVGSERTANNAVLFAEKKYQKLSGLGTNEIACVQWPLVPMPGGKKKLLHVAFGPNLLRLGKELAHLSGVTQEETKP